MSYARDNSGRFFVFEHPAGAASWATKVVRQLQQDPRVDRVVFDFCALGMRSTYSDGSSGPALKRTGLLTNSKHVAGALSKARCCGLHKHAQLVSGRAKACEIYPDTFCNAILQGICRELEDKAWLDKVYEELESLSMVGELHSVRAQYGQHESPPEDEEELDNYST